MQKHWADWRGPRGLHIVDVAIRDEKAPATLDIKLRNTGADVCFIKEMVLRIHQVGVLHTISLRFSQQLVTAEYDAEFDLRTKAPHDLVIPVSQVVDPNGTDRFEVRLLYPGDFNFYHVRTVLVPATLTAIYDEDSAITPPVELIFTVPPPRIIRGERGVSNEEHVRRAAENRSICDAMLALPGCASSAIVRYRQAIQQATVSLQGGQGVTEIGQQPNGLADTTDKFPNKK